MIICDGCDQISKDLEREQALVGALLDALIP